MSTICEHNRKSWNCRLCKIDAAAALDGTRPEYSVGFDTAASPDVSKLSDLIPFSPMMPQVDYAETSSLRSPVCTGP